MANLDKLNSIISPTPSKWQEEAQWRKENRDWLKKSAKIAVRVLLELKERKMSQIDLATVMNVSPQYINKIVKGKEKLNLETICKLEIALSIKLISVLSFEETQIYTMPLWSAMTATNEISTSVKGKKMDFAETANYSSNMTLRPTG